MHKERQKGRSSNHRLVPQMATVFRAEAIRNQGPGASSRSPHERRVPRTPPILCCFPMPQAQSWKGSGAAGTLSGSHMEFQHVLGKD